MARVKIVKNERDPPLFTGKLLIKFQNIQRNTTQVIVWHRICLQTDGRQDGHGETSIPPLQLRCGGYNDIKNVIVEMRKSGHKLQEIADTLNIPWGTVSDVVVHFKCRGSVENKPHTGRHRLLDERDTRVLVRLVRSDSSAFLVSRRIQ
jgi:hypothetical protein